MDDLDARYLAYRFMITTDRRAGEVFDLCRRVLGFRGRSRHRVVWSDAIDLLTVLIMDNALFAAGIWRRVAAAERRAGTSVSVERRAVA